jgi:serine/threonine protein kinase
MTTIFIVSDSLPEQQIAIPVGPSTLGRGEEASIKVPSISVSRLHALIERTGQAVWITDLNSRNGTFLNGNRLLSNTRTLVWPGDELTFASAQFVIHGVQQQETTLDCQPQPPSLASTASETHPFGFQPSSVTFLEEGLPSHTVQKLSKKYTPIQILNSGGMGKILLVQESMTGRFVALKVMLDRYLYSEPHVQQFVREAVITARLQHPNVIPVYDLGFLDDYHLYYTMRYVDGVHFGRQMTTATLVDNLQTLRLAAQGVFHAHQAGLWHRDIKPNNILVDKNGDVFVIDWGLVSLQPGRNYRFEIPSILVQRKSFFFHDDLIERTKDAVSTVDSATMGTPRYMSPEQCRNDPLSMGIVSDIWAFGVMLFEVLTGEHPLPGVRDLRAHEIIEKVKDVELPPPNRIRSSTPEALNALCCRMISNDWQRRMQSLKEFVDVVGAFLRNA